MKPLDIKLNEHFAGKVVRKDLTKLVKGNAIVPTYVLEYLLGQYCATDDVDTIAAGVERVKDIIQQHFVHRDEANVIKSRIRESGSHRIIDKVSVKLNEKRDLYEATFANISIKNVPISDDYIKKHQKLLSEGIWCIVTMGYFASDDKDTVPWHVESLKPIQMSQIDLEEYKAARGHFDKEEWVDILMQTIGLNPEAFSFRSKLLQLCRLIPFVENNYNLIELGPKGTGKSHIFSEMSPHGILLSGGEVTKAKLFVNNSSGDIGLVGYWDVVAYDEFAGQAKTVDRGLVDIMKNYMANRSFSRGTQVYQASASMCFVGNTAHSVPYMLKNSDLFEALPKAYYDTAFLDRMHAYLPGWEVQKLRNEMFTDDYGFIVDYLAEILKTLRKDDYLYGYDKYFELSDSITTRDKDGISKTFSGLVKVIYPHAEYTEEECRELLDFAIECRKRVKQQLIKMDETFEEVDFTYMVKSSGLKQQVETLEMVNFAPKAVSLPDADTSNSASPSSEGDGLTSFSRQPTEPSATEGQVLVRDNQTGMSYDILFGPYLRDASHILITDPYIRLPYQLKNFMEFAQLVSRRIPEGEEVKIHLATSDDHEQAATVRESLEQIVGSLEPLGIYLSFEFDKTLHDRSIIMDNGWKIILGRGLDIFQRTGGWFDIADYDQTLRKCKGCEVTYLFGRG